MGRPPFEVADVIRVAGDSFRQRYLRQMTRSSSDRALTFFVRVNRFCNYLPTSRYRSAIGM